MSYMKYRLYLILILLLNMLCGCTSGIVHDHFDDVESYIFSSPDSALTVLENVERDLLSTSHLRARHALLHAMALDKNFIDVSEDSIARVAVDYYKNHGSRKNYARALYYLGVAYYYQRDYNRAILEFTKAEKIAERHDSLYWGMVKMIQADTYRETYNEVEQLKCMQDASKIFNEISAEYYFKVAELRLAQILIDQFEYDSAEDILRRLLCSENMTDALTAHCMRCYAYVKVLQSDDNAEEAIEIFDGILSDYGEKYMTIQCYWAYAYALNVVGNTSKQKELVQYLIKGDTSELSSYWQYRIARFDGRTGDALKFLEESNHRDNEIITTALNQTLSLTQRDYYATQTELMEYKSRNRMWMLLSIMITMLLGLFVVLYAVARYVRRVNEEKVANLLYAEELIRQFKLSQEEDSASLKNKFINLYKSQFDTLRVLCDEYFMNQCRPDAERILYQKVVNIINEIRTDTCDRSQFERMLNDAYDDVMVHLRAELPDLKDMDLAVFGYLAIGFDATTISYLMNKSINTVYIRKSRIKSMIENNNPPHRDQFFKIMG